MADGRQGRHNHTVGGKMASGGGKVALSVGARYRWGSRSRQARPQTGWPGRSRPVNANAGSRAVRRGGARVLQGDGGEPVARKKEERKRLVRGRKETFERPGQPTSVHTHQQYHSDEWLTRTRLTSGNCEESRVRSEWLTFPRCHGLREETVESDLSATRDAANAGQRRRWVAHPHTRTHTRTHTHGRLTRQPRSARPSTAQPSLLREPGGSACCYWNRDRSSGTTRLKDSPKTTSSSLKPTALKGRQPEVIRAI